MAEGSTPISDATIDVLVVGGGTAGATVAGILARDTDLRVLLLEAGPDYGPLSAGRWPADLLEARCLPGSHGWGYSGLAHPSHDTPTSFDRARVIGGCSAHNGCVALLGHRRDYDHWAELGNTGWDWESVAPAFERAKRGLRVRLVDDAEVTPYQRAFVEGAVASGIPRVLDLNDPDDVSAVAPSPVNIHDGRRWNAALGYLDPVRERPNLTVVGRALVDRVEVRAGRAVAVQAIVAGERRRFPARRVVLAAGAYGSPAVLQRSGIGAVEELGALGIAPVHDLPGVGRRLADHPTVVLEYRGAPELDQTMEEFGGAHWLPDEQTLVKTQSRRCREAFDLHLYAVSNHDRDTGVWRYVVDVSSMAPVSFGSVALTSADPEAAPTIDHGYLSDPEQRDLNVLIDGVEIARRIMGWAGNRRRLAGELQPGPEVGTRDEIAGWVQRRVGIYYHPGCSCRMGPASDPEAVVDTDGKVHGLDGLYVCDASIFPTLMRANTNLPAAMLAEHLAGRIGEL